MGVLLSLSSTLRIMSSEIDNNLSSSANNLSSSVILKEEFDEGFEPTKEGKCKKEIIKWGKFWWPGIFSWMNIADFMNEQYVCVYVYGENQYFVWMDCSYKGLGQSIFFWLDHDMCQLYETLNEPYLKNLSSYLNTCKSIFQSTYMNIPWKGFKAKENESSRYWLLGCCSYVLHMYIDYLIVRVCKIYTMMMSLWIFNANVSFLWDVTILYCPISVKYWMLANPFQSLVFLFYLYRGTRLCNKNWHQTRRATPFAFSTRWSYASLT